MTGGKFFSFLGVVFLITLVIYLATTPKGSDIPLIGIVDGNEVIVSPQITGRMIKLTVDEGSEVKKGDLIAQLDPAELEAQLAQDVANIGSLEAKVRQSQQTLAWTNEQTEAALSQAAANLTSVKAQLEQARATLELAEVNYKRAEGLFQAGVNSAQDRDQAESTVKAARANVKSLEDQVKAAAAALAVAQANRKQVQVQQADVASTEAQLRQARAARDQAQTQFSYTRIYAPIDGIVSVRVAKQGEVVAQGAPIVVVVDVDHLWVRADVEESYIDSIRFGDKMKVRLPSGNVIEGSVIFKGVESDYATQRDVSRTKRDIKTFAIKVAVPNPDRRLFTGMTATVLLPQPAQKKSWFARL
ncbi:MAG: efflux RND transporter periplasmic adaptor subunit [Candidatus Acidiferrales bacterium]